MRAAWRRALRCSTLRCWCDFLEWIGLAVLVIYPIVDVFTLQQPDKVMDEAGCRGTGREVARTADRPVRDCRSPGGRGEPRISSRRAPTNAIKRTFPTRDVLCKHSRL